MAITDVLPYIGVDEIASDKVGLLKALVAEMMGTLFLVVVGCGSCYANTEPDVVRIALAFGLAVATMAQSIGHISGCHINPAVTAGLFVGRKIGLIKAILYIIIQCVGALLGAGLLYGTAGSLVVGGEKVMQGMQGITRVTDPVNAGQAFGIEFMITMVLVLVVFGAAADEDNEVKGSAPLAIGLSITACHLFAIPLTGSSMNPARSLGSNAVNGVWKDLWVYWVGPILGGVVAGLIYQLVLAAPAPKEVTKDSYQAVEMKDKDQA